MAAIADARRAAGLSQKELADHLRVPLWMVDRMERGAADAGEHLSAITEITGWDRESLTPPRDDEHALEKSKEPASRGTAVQRTHENEHMTTLRQRSHTPLRAGPARESGTLNDGSDTAVPASDGIGSDPKYVRNVVLLSIATLVTIRFFAEDVRVLPRATKLVDIPILLMLLVLFWLGPQQSMLNRQTARYLLAGVMFFAVCTASVLVNAGRVEPAPALLFIYGFLAPLAIFHVVRELWPAGQALSFSRLLVFLACVQFAVVFAIDLPRFVATDDPDVVSGTFGENAYQLVFFLLMCAALVAGIMTFERARIVGRLAPLFFIATVATILLAQYRSLLLTSALTVLLVATLLGLVSVRGAFAGVLIVVAFALSISYIPSAYPALKLDKTISTISGHPGSYISKRLEVGGDVATLYTDKPGSIILGTGPGTYSSRAWETFADLPSKSTSSLGVQLPALGGSGGAYRTDVAEKYVVPRLKRRETVEGSFALDSPLSSYYALLAEVGLVGFVLLIGLYGRALIDAVRMTLVVLRLAPMGDPLPGLLLASTAGFFVILQMAILENWLEVTRITFILWALFGVATKEYEARYETLTGGREAPV